MGTLIAHLAEISHRKYVHGHTAPDPTQGTPTDLAQGTVTFRAEVTSGPLAGDTVTAAPVAATVNTDCPTSGLKPFSTAAAALNFA